MSWCCLHRNSKAQYLCISIKIACGKHFSVILESWFKSKKYSKTFLPESKHTCMPLFCFSGQQWSDESKVGKLVDGHTDFEGNGIFSKLLLDVSLFCKCLMICLN